MGYQIFFNVDKGNNLALCVEHFCTTTQQPMSRWGLKGMSVVEGINTEGNTPEY